MRIGPPGDSGPPPPLLAEMVREHLGKGRRISLRTGGLSMIPLLPPGVLLTLRPLDPGEVPGPGSLVALVVQDHLVCHLLRDRRKTPSGTEIQTAGLLPDHPDPWTDVSEVLGIVCEVRLGSRALPVSSEAFRAWQTLARQLAPSLRVLKRGLRLLVPPGIRRRVYRLLATPFGS
ncbi:MAG TPA: hypothetical protein PLQ97_14730 [Myxococcota bacterium]|nr:hypothetical protein [Myxococcota bacterium]HQK51497.1 hypothetical protein [Myxococcota bacterium]